ncbi:hypothetical protein Rhopal_003382-T1 [Rhodotorula paludigena]|uniref:Zn(2)-C6 fungal-type domain-containing protein n=1 Tax=Rhodotorula paludigena TaxID=86838 RepID=A0AAV5GLH9_9BASI|nr:hypothetical protein Rhopal_003382-T1 [Rhodotorula paludigena]
MPTHAHGAPRSHSAHPSSSHSWSESPSPTKKRRVDSVPLAHAGPSSARERPHKPQSYHGSSSAASNRSPRSYTAEPVDPQLQSRLHSSTIRLRDAWDDILRRHSTPHAGPPAASSPFSRSASAAPAFPTPRRHREAGRTRAIPVDEDDIIDLGTMEIVEDRGVLRRTRAGAFSLGGYSHMLDDIIVGPDTGVGEGEAGEWSEDEEEVEDEPSERDDGRAGDLDDESDDELGDMEELPSLPSLLYREERRRVEEQRDQLRDFWEQEARTRGSHSAGVGRDEEDVFATGLSPASAHGSRTVAKPPTIEEVTEDEDDVDELDFFAEAGDSSPSLRRSTSSPLDVDVVTPTRERRSPSRSAPSTTAAIRHGMKNVALATPPTSRSTPSPSTSKASRLSALPSKVPSTKLTPMKLDSSPLKPNLAHGAACLVCRKRKRRCDGTQPACGPCKSLEIPCAYALQKRSHSVSPAKRSTPASRAISAPPPPKSAPPAPRPKLVPKSPASFAVRKASRPSVAHTPSSRPPLSSSPLREVITVASPSPSPSPSPAPSPSPSPSPAPQSRQRAISPELGLSTTAREQHVSVAGPSRLEHAQPYQHPTPTPTPPPFAPKHMSTVTSPGPRRHSFELVLDIKPHLPRKNLPTSGGAARAAAPSDAKGKSRAREVDERDELRKESEAELDVRPTGLSTPPLSKRAQPAQPPRTARGRSSSASSSSSAPDIATKSSPRSACPSPAAARKRTRSAPRPSQILPRAATAAADDSPDELEVDDPLLLSSPIKTSRRAATATPAPAAVLASGGSGQGRRARGRSSGAWMRAGEGSDEDESDDEFGGW